jgi:pilus assembly protein CpaE
MPGQDKIRVVIADDIAETRENIKRLLQFDPTVEIVGTARSGKEVIELTSQLNPDVIIMDINMPDMDGIVATETVRRILPYTQVIILSIQNDPNYLRRAMVVGARDFLTKPPSIDDLVAAVKRAGAVAVEERTKFARASAPAPVSGKGGGINQPSAKGKIVVVYSPKGGVGCTTIATNLAVALQSETSPTVLIDGNIQFGDIPVFLNEQQKNSILDLATRIEELDYEIVQEVMIKHAATGLHVLPAPPKPEMAENLRGDQFGKLIQYLCGIYSYVVVDTASYLTDVVQNALEYSDLIILVTSQDIPSIRDCNLFLSLADASGIKRDRILFVMNRYDKKIGVSPERVGESLRQPIVEAIPFDDKLVGTSIIRGVPFMIDNRANPVGKSVLNIASLINEKLKEKNVQPEKTGRK